MTVKSLRYPLRSGNSEERWPTRASPLKRMGNLADAPLSTQASCIKVLRTHLRVLQKRKVLRLLQAGQFIPSRLTRINKDSSRSSLAVMGGVMILGPNLVARPVGSERRNHHLLYMSNQTME